MLVFIWGGYYLEGSNLGRALGWILALTGILIVPLFLSLWALLTKAAVQATLKEKLLRETITVGQQVDLMKPIEVDWNKNPPEVYLSVLAKTPVTPKQVTEVEDYLYRRLGRRFSLIFQVSQVQEIRSAGTSPPTPEPKKSLSPPPAPPTPPVKPAAPKPGGLKRG
jgi:hypothetical protein